MMGNALWHLISQSDAVSKGVLLSLLFMSIACWTLFIYKLILISTKRKQLAGALAQLQHLRTLDEVFALAVRHTNTLPGYLINSMLTFLKSELELNKARAMKALSTDQYDQLHEYSYQLVDDTIAQEEYTLPFLSASAAIAPLIGLFGTVWGLIHAFIGISEKQSADIATVAPGIAEALITTLAGLLVAIPALAMFVYLQMQIRTLEQLGIKVADKVNHIVQRLVA